MALKGFKVLELAGLAPAPFCGMILSDFGALVTRIDRVKGSFDVDRLCRGKRSIALDLQQKEGAQVLRHLCKSADVLIEPYRKGVLEKLGLGPDVLMKDNPKLIVARLTGFGQNGPFASMAGHDINYLALSGVLSMFRRKDEKPFPPINLLADFAGGGMMCALGICMALLERQTSGLGQIIDANMVEGSAYIGSWLWTGKDMFIWGKPQGENFLDSGAHFYDTYKTKDEKFMAVGALEPQFYAQLIKGLGVDPESMSDQLNFEENKPIFTKVFATKTQAEWCAIFDGKDACVTPVLTLDEAPSHPHNAARNSFMKNESTGSFEPRPAPILNRTPSNPSLVSPKLGEHTVEVLAEAGYSKDDIEKFIKSKIAITPAASL